MMVNIKRREKMSKLSSAKKNKKVRLSLKGKANKSTLERKKQLTVKATNFNVFEMENSSNEEADRNLEIFPQKGMKKSSLPSIITLLSSTNKDSGILPLLNNSIEKCQQPRVQNCAQNEDIFISKFKGSTFKYNENFDKDTSSPLDNDYKKSKNYSISDMFSDGLSQKINSGKEFSYASNSDDSQTDLLPYFINVDAKKSGDFLFGKNGAVVLGSNSPRENFEKKQQLKETSNCSYELNNSLEVNKEFEKNKAVQNSSSKDPGTTSLLHDSIKKSRQPRIRRYDKNLEPCIVCRDENLAFSSNHGIYENSKGCSISDMFTLGNSTHGMICDVSFERSEPYTIDIPLSECNLDHTTNSEDLIDGSNEMANQSAIWHMDGNYFMESGPDLIAEDKSVLCKSTRINYNGDENLELSDLMLNTENSFGNDFVIESAEANNSLQHSFQSSDSLIEMLNVDQLLGRGKISLTPNVHEFVLSQNYRNTFEEKNVIHSKSRRSSFGIPQYLYTKQRSPFFNRKKTKDEGTLNFKLFDSVGKKVEQFGPEIQLPAYPNLNYTSKYGDNDSDKEYKRQILYPQKQRDNLKDFRREFTDPSLKKYDSSTSTKKYLKRCYPFDKSFNFFNVEMNDNRNTCKKEKQVAENTGKVQNTWSDNPHLSIAQLSSSSFNASNISDQNLIQRSNPRTFWKVSHQVQSFVKEWSDREDAIDCRISKKCVEREKLSLKRRRLDVDSKKTEKRINIDPKMLLSNYSCEYDRAYMIERFKI